VSACFKLDSGYPRLLNTCHITLASAARLYRGRLHAFVMRIFAVHTRSLYYFEQISIDAKEVVTLFLQLLESG
jgi:hypothetical protein